MMEICYVLFGSNMVLQRGLGTSDKNQIFDLACHLIINRCGHVVKVSSSYESEPWGFEAEEWFLNRVIVVETELAPEEMLRQLLDIEKELGRIRHPEKQGYTSRTADLDLLYYGDHIIHTDILTVPHPRLHLRRFALVPMCEVAPDYVHPILQMTQTDLLQQCPDDGIVRRVENEETI